MMIDGFFIDGPLLHYAYNLLENYMPAKESVLGTIMQMRDKIARKGEGGGRWNKAHPSTNVSL